MGAPLYEVDTDATASATSSSSSASSESKPAESPPKEEAPSATAAAKEQPAPPPTTSTPTRTPSIQFLGKEGWAARLRGEESTSAAVAELPPIHPMYGRPAFSEEEMEAFMLGGADQAPKLISYSTGSKFAY